MSPDFNTPVTVIGAGNVGHHLALRFFQQGIAVRQVFSRDFFKAEQLALQIQAEPIDQLTAVDPEVGVLILAVKDEAIPEVAKCLAEVVTNPLIVHTSGATPGTVFEEIFRRYGVFYPLQSFSLARKVDFEKIPICIHANANEDLELLHQLGSRISGTVRRIDDRERAVLHVAAVFANNFSNFLYYSAERILSEEGIDFELLKPLIYETAGKIGDHAPLQMQTGPAIRGDRKTLEKHLQFLERHPDLYQLYQILSAAIEKMKAKRA